MYGWTSLPFCHIAFNCNRLSLTCKNMLQNVIFAYWHTTRFRQGTSIKNCVNYGRKYGWHIVHCFREWQSKIAILILEFRNENENSINHISLPCVKIQFVVSYKTDLSRCVWTVMERSYPGSASWYWRCWYSGCYCHSQFVISVSTEWIWHTLLVLLWNNKYNRPFIKIYHAYLEKYLYLRWM
jgi:hypothetical protein